MEHIQKYKIEDESLDDQTDNFIYSQNSNINKISTKNNNFSKIAQNKTIKVSQPKMQLNDLSVSSNKKPLNQNSIFIKSEMTSKINNNNNILNMNNINNNFKSLNNVNMNNLSNKEAKTLYSIQDKNLNNINNINNNPMMNSEMNFTNLEINEDITDIAGQNVEENLIGNGIDEIKNTDKDLDQENNDNLNDNNDMDNAYHHVQVIDEDVENFKRRLDIMVKNFRTDTLKDFMAIKRNLLIEQKTCIENEKQKCDALLSSKSDLIEHLKDDLAKTQKSLNSQIIIKEKLVEILFKKNHDKILKNLKSLAFHGVLLKYHNKKKVKKDKIKKMRKKHWDNYKNTFFKNLKQNWREMKIYKIVSVKEKACDDKLNEMAQYYGKEINDLRNKLNEANSIIEQSNQAKAQIQENLKKVLMRGVMAMNMEAMNVLDKDVLPKTDISAIADNIMNNVNIPTTTTNNTQNNNNIEGCFTTVNKGISNNNSNNTLLNQNNSGVNIKVGVNEDSNLMATVIPANQSFQPNMATFKNANNNLNNNNTLLNNTNPINKDSYWLNAPSVPIDIQKNIISTDNKFNREAMIMTLNNNNINNNILNNIEIEHENQGNDFDDELNSRTYNISPMNPIDTKYINSNHSLMDNNAKMPQYNYNNNPNYYDELQQNMLGIKNEFSMIKQNQSSMLDEDSLNSYAIGNKNIISSNMNNNSNNKTSFYATTNNTSNNNNRSNSKKGISNNHINIGNKKGNIKNNKVPSGKNNINSNKKNTLNTKNKK